MVWGTFPESFSSFKIFHLLGESAALTLKYFTMPNANWKKCKHDLWTVPHTTLASALPTIKVELDKIFLNWDKLRKPVRSLIRFYNCQVTCKYLGSKHQFHLKSESIQISWNTSLKWWFYSFWALYWSLMFLQLLQ